MQAFSKISNWARKLRRDVVALRLSAGDRRVPWHAKAVAGAVAAYALSPIDLIPDFIPVLGYIDDLLIVPLGIYVAVRLVPSGIMEELRTEAAMRSERPISLGGLIFILALWALCIIFLLRWFLAETGFQ